MTVVLVGALIGVGTVTLSFSTFMSYDDEGYVLFSLKDFTEGGGLYSRVYSQYGPFFFLFHQALHVVGFDFTNVEGRLLTLGCWLGAIGFCGALAWRFTRSPGATAFTMGGVCLHVFDLISSPAHPGGFIVLVTAAAAWLGGRWRDASPKLAAATGLIGAALLLTKINVGVFFLFGAGSWWLLHLNAAGFTPRRRTLLAALALAAMPFALTRPILDQPWVATFALVAACGGLTTVLAAAGGVRPATRRSDLLWLGGAAAVVVAVTATGILSQGTSWRALLDGVVFGPLSQPLAYSAAVNWPTGTAAVGLASLALAGWVTLGPSSHRFAIVASGRLIVALLYLTGWLVNRPLGAGQFTLVYGLGAAWLFVQPLGGDGSTQPVRAWLGLLFVTQALHGFPVAGSQVGWGTFLFVPLIAIGVHDLVRLHADHPPPLVRRLRFLASALLLAVIAAGCANFARFGYTRIRGRDSLRLPGAETLQLAEKTTTSMRVLARNAAAHAEMLFTLPGLQSFHLWTGVPPPTGANATHWFYLLTLEQQEEIRVRLEAAPRSCLIVERSLYDLLAGTQVMKPTPLVRWLLANYEPAFALAPYEFWVRKGRTIAPIDTATLLEAAAGNSPRYCLALTLAASDLRRVTTIELGRFDGGRSTPVKTWTATDAQLTLTPLNSAGAATGPGHRVAFPFDANGIVRLDLFVEQFPPNCPLESCVLYLRDATGARVAEARFLK